jgi:hypothetical protein
MKNSFKSNDELKEEEVLKMIDDTSKLVVKKNINMLAQGAVAAQNSNVLANKVEFWKWMDRNYANSGIFSSNNSMQQYISQGTGKEEWVIKQLQGKGYEWDWMAQQRNNIKNLFNRYDAGDVANRAVSDITETNIFTGKSTEYQMKAYTGKSNPHLTNTPKDMAVVTNSEKAGVVQKNGYENVESFQDNQLIKKSTDSRLEEIKNGSAEPVYNLKNVSGTMVKAGLIGCVIGMGTEAVFSYKAWKNGQISDEEYLKEVLKAGGDAGVTAGITSGIMVPVSAAITVAGVSSIVTIPVAIAVSGIVNKVVAPCFGRGEYRKILSQAKYYQNLENVYDDLVISMENASNQYYNFIENMKNQYKINKLMKQKSLEMDMELKNLYDKI